MKIRKIISIIKNTLLVTTGLFVTSCANKIILSNEGLTPAATGTIKVKQDRNSNYRIDIQVLHLAPAENLQPPKKTYVAWITTENNGNKNIGQLNSSTGLFSKALKGSLKTVTSFKPTGFFITAEENGAIAYPGTTVILSKNIN